MVFRIFVFWKGVLILEVLGLVVFEDFVVVEVVGYFGCIWVLWFLVLKCLGLLRVLVFWFLNFVYWDRSEPCQPGANHART